MTDAKVVEKKIYEEGKKHDDYASKATGNAGLTLGIIGTALGAGAWLLGGNNRSVFGSLGGGNMPENVNINAYGANASSNQPTALQVMEKECDDEVKLLTYMLGMKLDTANKFYAMRETDSLRSSLCIRVLTMLSTLRTAVQCRLSLVCTSLKLMRTSVCTRIRETSMTHYRLSIATSTRR